MARRAHVLCPKCGARELSLIEITENVGITDPGVIERDERGNLIPPGRFDHSPGRITQVSLLCGCGHQWTPRRTDRRAASVSTS